ncbi:acyl-CoA dehydrogenase [Nocardiopsis sp. CT-R113]|uniref:Acyl-CoA dehydrogenase n=1 Tax=Nocardiopsis codii TaxID=3065942 RepID=A0ABU7KAS5_9ACTN|nr:acyl-CoA dehydrogenase [Nocardiopsis sp. CT-R113]MEE2039331.1 acyl-CoA dehydrogenase [Nocardiopsis sp. CT-R113]
MNHDGLPAPSIPADDPSSTSHEPDKELRARLTDALYGSGPEFDRVHAPWRALMSTPAFGPVQGLGPQERTELSYERLRLVDASFESARDLASCPERLAALHEWTSSVDGGLTTVAGIHYNLFLGSLLDHDHDALADFEGMPRIGTFLCTELDHGNDAAALRTTATRVPGTGGFVLSTPGPGARKFMPNTGSPGGPKSAVVAARLVADGEDHGVFLFLVPLTGAAGPLPGITVEPLDDKSGSPVDHCLTSFDGVPLPAGSLLSGDHGRFEGDAFESDTRNRRQRFLRAIDRVTVGKLCMSAAAGGAARAAVAIAVAHGLAREITAPHGGARVPVFAMRSHHGPIVGAIATAYAMTLLHRATCRAHREGAEHAERLAAITKGWTTWRAREVTTECRERAGARGLFPANRLADLRADIEGLVTAEGDNVAVWVKAGAQMLLDHPLTPPPAAPAGRDLADPAFLVELLTAVEHLHLSRARHRLRQAPSGNPLGRWNRATSHALGAVDAHAQRRAAQEFLGGPDGEAAPPELTDLFRLFALERLSPHTGDLLAEGYMSAGQVTALPDLVEDLITALAPRAQDLVAAFHVPDQVLASVPIADGRPHDGLARRPG